MLRVYWMCPGVSAMMNLRRGRGEVAVGDVDGDALLALGAQAVGEQREVGDVVRRGPRLVARRRSSWSSKIALRVVEQPADEGGLAVVDATRGRDAQTAGGHQK